MIRVYDLMDVARQKDTLMLTYMTDDDYKKRIRHWKAKAKLKFLKKIK